LVEWRLAGETEVLGENCPSATFSTTNPTWLDPGLNPGRRGGMAATNRLSYGAGKSVVSGEIGRQECAAYAAYSGVLREF
jgi:hypothetical protein